MKESLRLTSLFHMYCEHFVRLSHHQSGPSLPSAVCQVKSGKQAQAMETSSPYPRPGTCRRAVLIPISIYSLYTCTSIWVSFSTVAPWRREKNTGMRLGIFIYIIYSPGPLLLYSHKEAETETPETARPPRVCEGCMVSSA